MSCLDRLVENVRIVSTEANDFLSQPRVSTRRELHSAAIPQLVSMRYRIRHAAAGCFHGVFSHRLRLKWRQLAMPVHRSGTAVDRGAHTVILSVAGVIASFPQPNRGWMDWRYRTMASIRALTASSLRPSRLLKASPHTGISKLPCALR